jgi:hypothetical protein
MRLAKNRELREAEFEMCRRDPWWFATGWVWTRDEHADILNGENPIKKYPDKEYLRILFYHWLTNPIVLIPKSRQMMISWSLCVLHLWEAMFYKCGTHLFVSKEASSADRLIQKCMGIYERLPAFLKRAEANTGNKGKHVFCKMEFENIESVVLGLKRGEDKVREFTITNLWMDEVTSNPEARKVYSAALPAVHGGGRITLSSSIDLGFFNDMVNDEVSC